MDGPRSTRGEFLRRAAGGGVGLYLLGGGEAASRLLAAGRAAAATAPTTSAFRSRPDLRPPTVTVTRGPGGAPAGGYLFIAPSAGPGQRGVLILDDAGEPVWFHPTVPKTAMNFRAALYRGKPVLTWWEGKSQRGTGVGDCVIVDDTYRELARFGADHRPVDLHEFLITPRGTALVTSIAKRRADLRPVGGRPNRPVLDSVIQELELPSGRVLFEWSALDHVPLTESHQKIGPLFDFFHANSIALDFDGNLLVSARNTWAVYKLDRDTGDVIWRLGGKASDFAMGPGTRFAWQHDARSHEGGALLSLFDDAAAPAVEPQSRGLVLALDTKRMTATLRRAFVHRPRLLAKFTGSMQVLPDGGALVGWGSEPYFTEFAPDGRVRLDAELPHGGQTYRALRFPWVGRPAAAPVLAAGGGPRPAAVYASWNGATEVASWRLLAGTSRTLLRPEPAVARTGFETALALTGAPSQAAVEALDRHGHALGRSAVIPL